MKRGIFHFCVFTFTVLFLAFYAYGQDIPIGFFAPITGPAAADGASAKHAVELGLKEVNDAGGIKGKKINLIIYDDRLNPREAVAIANKLIEKDKVVGVVSGSYSRPTE